VFRDPATRGLVTVPFAGKLLAAASLVLWAGAITAGRLMAYVGNEFVKK
jgi:hypothetical protein